MPATVPPAAVRRLRGFARRFRRAFLPAADTVVVASALALALLVFGPGGSAAERLRPFGPCLAILLLVRLPALTAFGLGRWTPQASTRRELPAIVVAAGLGTACLVLVRGNA